MQGGEQPPGKPVEGRGGEQPPGKPVEGGGEQSPGVEVCIKDFSSVNH